ncbi:hypothetical protein [Marinoscillum sp.]|uniref:hypothetical protein n=1 Tax=Marinoscillum sp. TaxID=2024838 RepID=UPI003BA9AFE8
MNTTSSFLASLLVIFLLITGCKKDEGSSEDPIPEDPTLTVLVDSLDNPGELTVDLNTVVRFNASMTAPAGISSFRAEYTVDDASTTIDIFEPDTITTSYIMSTFQFPVDFTMAGKTITFSFVLTDTLGVKDEEVFSLQVNESPIVQRQGKVASPYNQLTYGNLYDVSSDTLYFPINVKSNTDNQKGVDIIFAYDAAAGYLLHSPNDVNADSIWNHNVNFSWPFLEINSTRMIELDTGAVKFDEIVTAAQMADFFEGTSSSVVTGLYQGAVIALKLDAAKGSKLALMHITSIVGDKRKERLITFDLKIEQ